MPNRHRYFLIQNGRRTEELINGKWIPAGESAPEHGHNLIRDHLGEGVRGIYNPATRKRYDSRSRYLADTKAHGGEVVGNDQPMTPPPRAKVRESFADTIGRLSQQKGWNL